MYCGGVVDMLIPAYNCEKYIFRLFDSILNQTYNNIHIIIINDGSTDKTEEVIYKYELLFKQRGFSVDIINQDNLGVSSAVNNGLKYVLGDYLVWPDSDDWYASNDAIQKMVDALEKTDDDCAIARCAYNDISEADLKLLRTRYPNQPNCPVYIFKEAVLREPGFWLEPGGWMLKTKFLDSIIPNREIYHSRLTGQNSQLLWPFLYYKKCISIEEPLFNYLVRENSHSRNLFGSYQKKIDQQEEYYETFINVLNSINGLNPQQLEEYNRRLLNYKYYAQFMISFDYRAMKDSRFFFKELLSIANHEIPFACYVKYIFTFIPFMGQVLDLNNKLKNVQ